MKLLENHWVLGIEIQLRTLKAYAGAYKTSFTQKWIQREKSAL